MKSRLVKSITIQNESWGDTAEFREGQARHCVSMGLTSFEKPTLLDDVGSRWNAPAAGPSRHLRHLQQKHIYHQSPK